MQQLSFLPGEMTPGERSLIQRALKTLDRHLHEPGVAFTSTRAAREWLILNMAGLEREEFRVLYLNNQNQLIAGETLFTGTINRTEVHPREVIKRALYHNAAAVVLAHNHPSGEVTPSILRARRATGLMTRDNYRTVNNITLGKYPEAK